MEIVNTLISAGVVAAVGLLLAWQAKGRFDAVQKQIGATEARVGGLQASLDARVDGLQASLDARVDGLQVALDAMRNQLQGSLDAMRSDLTQVALVVGARPRAENA